MALSERFAETREGMSLFARFAWLVLTYNVAVVLWGAFVRASGSGAGCGAHWPLCNGEVIPQSPGTAMAIEFTHRVMSGLALPVILVLLVWAWRAYPKGSLVRAGAGLSVLFTVTEALVGAGLVLFQLVAQNASSARALWVGVHLVNTFLLLASIALTAWWASPMLGGRLTPRIRGRVVWFLALGLLGVLALGTTGAITALGDTLFPSSSIAQGLQQDLDPTASFLIRLRVIHPFLAIAVGVYVILLARVLNALHPDTRLKPLTGAVMALVVLQGMAGVVNIYLLAPIWMQMVHLLLADLVWIALVLLSAAVLAQPQSAEKVPFSRVWQAMLNTGSDT